jgi:hypothetical protein
MDKLEVFPDAVMTAALNGNPHVQQINAIMTSGKDINQVDDLLGRMDAKLSQTYDKLRQQSYPKDDASIMRSNFDVKACDAKQDIEKMHTIEVGLVYMSGLGAENSDEQDMRVNAVLQGARLADTECGFCPTLSARLEAMRQGAQAPEVKDSIKFV